MTKTMYDLIFENLKGKYFQFVLDPLVIIQSPDVLQPKRMGKSESAISAWAPLQKEFHEVPLDSSHLYREISKSKFEQIKGNYERGLVDKIEEAHLKDLKADRPKPTKEQS